MNWLILSIFILSIFHFPSAWAVNEAFKPKVQSTHLNQQAVLYLIKGLRVDPQQPLNLDFVLDTEQANQSTYPKPKARDIKKLINFFLNALTLPDEDLWVNLSPYEKNRIMTRDLAQTELGRVLLKEDLLLKRMSAQLTDPQSNSGKLFWKTFYQRMRERNYPVNQSISMMHKVWIVPDAIQIEENATLGIISRAHLTVLMESDYLARQQRFKTKVKTPQEQVYEQVYKDTMLKVMTEQVNQSEDFSPLRQVFYMIVLAKWFKQTFPLLSLNQMVISKQTHDHKNQVDLNDLGPNQEIERIYRSYLQSYHRGFVNTISQDENTLEERKYFSGGVLLTKAPLSRMPMQNPALVLNSPGWSIGVSFKPNWAMASTDENKEEKKEEKKPEKMGKQTITFPLTDHLPYYQLSAAVMMVLIAVVMNKPFSKSTLARTRLEDNPIAPLATPIFLSEWNEMFMYSRQGDLLKEFFRREDEMIRHGDNLRIWSNYPDRMKEWMNLGSQIDREFKDDGLAWQGDIAAIRDLYERQSVKDFYYFRGQFLEEQVRRWMEYHQQLDIKGEWQFRFLIFQLRALSLDGQPLMAKRMIDLEKKLRVKYKQIWSGAWPLTQVAAIKDVEAISFSKAWEEWQKVLDRLMYADLEGRSPDTFLKKAELLVLLHFWQKQMHQQMPKSMAKVLNLDGLSQELERLLAWEESPEQIMLTQFKHWEKQLKLNPDDLDQQRAAWVLGQFDKINNFFMTLPPQKSLTWQQETMTVKEWQQRLLQARQQWQESLKQQLGGIDLTGFIPRSSLKQLPVLPQGIFPPVQGISFAIEEIRPLEIAQ